MILHYTFTADSDSDRILKICQHLPKSWAIKYRVVFFKKHGVVYICPHAKFTHHLCRGLCYHCARNCASEKFTRRLLYGPKPYDRGTPDDFPAKYFNPRSVEEWCAFSGFESTAVTFKKPT